MLSEFINRAFRIFIDTNRRTTQIKRRHTNLRLDEFKSVTMKLEIINNLRRQRPRAACERRAKAWMKFFGGAGAADDVSPLKHQRFESCFRKIVSGDEAVMAGADDDCVSRLHKKLPQINTDQNVGMSSS